MESVLCDTLLGTRDSDTVSFPGPLGDANSSENLSGRGEHPAFGGRTALQGAPRPSFFVILLQGHLPKVTVPGPASGYGRCPSCGVSRTSVLAEGGRRDFTGVQEGIPDWGFLPTWDAGFPEISWSDQHSLQHSASQTPVLGGLHWSWRWQHFGHGIRLGLYCGLTLSELWLCVVRVKPGE